MGIKYSINENFFCCWSQEMAYVLGYIYADGSLEDASYLRGKYIRVSSTERKNIEKIKKWMESEHKIVKQVPSNSQHQTRYLLRVGSHKMYDDLVSLGLYPNKSLTVKYPHIPKKFSAHFVRGYFDGDGCVRVDMRKGKNQQFIIGKLCTVFTSGSKKFLEGLAQHLHEYADTKQLKIYNGNRSFMLSYCTEDSVKVFEYMYGKAKKEVLLERKLDRYSAYFELRPQRVDKSIESILQCLE